MADLPTDPHVPSAPLLGMNTFNVWMMTSIQNGSRSSPEHVNILRCLTADGGTEVGGTVVHTYTLTQTCSSLLALSFDVGSWGGVGVAFLLRDTSGTRLISSEA